MVNSIAIYADGADLESIKRLAGRCQGFTTNPSLLKASGITDYREFALAALSAAQKNPVSFEVFADDLQEMERQARTIAEWGANAVVKIPVMNSEGVFTGPLVERLSKDGVAVNVTAVFTRQQVHSLIECVRKKGTIISIFAGRIADSGQDPEDVFKAYWKRANDAGAKLLWASAREVFNVIQAHRSGADIITLPPAMIEKMSGFNRSLEEYSLETVRQFKKDAEGLTL